MAQLTRLIVTGGNCTITSAGEVTASSFIKTGSNDTKILLGGGGDIPITTYVSKTDYDKFVNGDTYQRALYKYDESNASAADTTLYPNLIAKKAPSMSIGRCSFYFYDTKFYSSQTNTANRTQVAYGYDTPEIFMRTYQSSAWSDWDKILTTSELKNSIYDNYVKWTSESVTGLNSTSPITAALEPLMFANRLSCYDPAYIVVEESLDKGQTWTVKDVPDYDKVGVFTNDYDAIIGSKKGAFIRITLTAYDLYCEFTKFIIDFSTNGQKSCYCEVQAATNSTPNNFITIGEGEVSGWNYWNTIAVKNDYIFRAFKNDTNHPNAFKKLRFVFTSKSDESTSSGSISIRHITGIAPMNYMGVYDSNRPYAACGSIATLKYNSGTIYANFKSDISCTGWLRTNNGVYFTNDNAGVYPRTIDSQIYLASYNNRPILAENDIVSKGGGFKIYEYKNDKTRILKANGKTAVFDYSHPAGSPSYVWGGNEEDKYNCYNTSMLSVNSAKKIEDNGKITAYDKEKQTAEEGGISPIVGLRVGEVYDNGYPCKYGNLIDMRLHGSSQIVMQWNSDKAYVYVRSRRDMTETPWNDWKRLAFADEIPDVSSYLKKDGSNAEEVTGSNILNKLSIGIAIPTDADYYISQYANGGSATTTYHRRPMSSLWNWINSKTINKAKSVSNDLTIKCGSKTNTYNGSSALTVDIDNLLANYATKAWTNSQNFATQSWVNQQGFIKSYTNSWRPIQLKGSQILENTTSSNPLNFAEGANITLTNSDGTITIKSSYTDTKNTAGSTNSTGKLFIVGSAAQSANSQTYSNSKCYIGVDSCLYSNDAKVLTAHQSLADYVKNTTIASGTDLGLVKVYKKFNEKFGWVGLPTTTITVPQVNYPNFVSGRYYSIITDSEGQAVVNVPWTDTTTFVPVDNSNNVTISLTPNSDNTLNIGTTSKRFASLYVNNISSLSVPSTIVYSKSFYDTAHSETDVLLGKGKVKSLNSIIYNVTPYKITNVSGAGNSDSWRNIYICSLGSGWIRYNRSFIVSGNFGSGILSIEIYGGQITSSSAGNEIYSKQANYSGSITSSFKGVRNINSYFKLYVYKNGTSRNLYLYYNAWNNHQCCITPLEYSDTITSPGTFNMAAANVSLPTSSNYAAFSIDSLVETTTSITALAFYQTSDYRKKNILESLHPKTCLDMCANIDVVKFNYKDDEQHKERIGVIAQDIEQYFPEVVNTDYDGYKSVDYSKLSVIAIRAIKQLRDEIEKLRKLIK